MAPHPSGQVSTEVRHRLSAITDLVHRLQEAKRKQDAQSLPGSKTGVWLSFQLWNRVLNQLNTQMAEVLEWEHLLMSSQKELAQAQSSVQALENELIVCQVQARDKVAGLEDTIQHLERGMAARESDWERVRSEMEKQTGLLLTDLHERAGVLQDNEQLLARLRALDSSRVQAETEARKAHELAAELQKKLTYLEGKHADVVSERDQLSFQARDLGMQLASAREQLESHKQLLAVRRQPSDQLLEECKVLRNDNRRLVALLAGTKEWKGMAERMMQEEGRARYIPMHEVLGHKEGIEGVYPALEDRPKVSKGSGPLAGELEEWLWVPQEAVEAVRDAVALVHPNAPPEPLFGMLLRVNKIWRRREAAALNALRCKHATELRELHQLYRQRAPYEAVVGRTRLVELKRQLRVQAMHAQHLADKADGEAKAAADDNKILLTLGLESVTSLSKEVGQLNKKASKLRKRLASKAKKPPVCTSCLDNMLLQTQPLQDGYLTKTVGRTSLSSPSATLIPGAPDTTTTWQEPAPAGLLHVPNTAVPPAHPLPAAPPTPSRLGPSHPDLHAAADQYTAQLAAKAGAGHTSAPSTPFKSSASQATVDLGAGAAAHSPGSTVKWPAAGEARVSRLNDLVREYARPVLQYSRWGQDGALKDAGRVRDVATGAMEVVQEL